MKACARVCVPLSPSTPQSPPTPGPGPSASPQMTWASVEWAVDNPKHLTVLADQLPPPSLPGHRPHPMSPGIFVAKDHLTWYSLLSPPSLRGLANSSLLRGYAPPPGRAAPRDGDEPEPSDVPEREAARQRDRRRRLRRAPQRSASIHPPRGGGPPTSLLSHPCGRGSAPSP